MPRGTMTFRKFQKPSQDDSVMFTSIFKVSEDGTNFFRYNNKYKILWRPFR